MQGWVLQQGSSALGSLHKGRATPHISAQQEQLLGCMFCRCEKVSVLPREMLVVAGKPKPDIWIPDSEMECFTQLADWRQLGLILSECSDVQQRVGYH